jgi:hypothetical protein
LLSLVSGRLIDKIETVIIIIDTSIIEVILQLLWHFGQSLPLFY